SCATNVCGISRRRQLSAAFACSITPRAALSSSVAGTSATMEPRASHGIGLRNSSFYLLLKRVESNTSFGDALLAGGKKKRPRPYLHETKEEKPAPRSQLRR